MKFPSTMRAIVAYGKNDYRLVRDFPTPECGEEDIIIKTAACGICASDLKCQQGAAMYWGDEKRSMVVHPPFIPGHEFYGTIVSVGKKVEGFEVGELVVPEQIVPCGKCRFCHNGQYWMCQTPARIFGFHETLNGGMAEYVKLPKGTRLYRIPEGLSMEKALLIEPYSCSKHCIDRAEITSEDIVVISGAGALGLGMVTYAHMLNPKMLISLDMIPERLEMAKKFGADIVMNPSEVNVTEEILKMTDGYGCDIYIEATGHPSSVLQGMDMIRKLGRFVEFGVFGQNVTLDWSIISDRKELDIRGVHLSPNSFEFVIDNITNGNLKTDGVVSSVYPIEEMETAFYNASGKDGNLKVGICFE